MIFKNNLEALKEHHRNVYDILVAEGFCWDEKKSSVCDAKNGEPIVVYNMEDERVFLNSRYNPSMEAKKYVEEFNDMPDKSVITMFGFANGSFARDVLENTRDGVSVIVFEPSVDIFMQVISNIDITDVLSDKKFVLIIDGINTQYYEIIMEKKLQVYNKTTCKHILLPKYASLFPQQCKNFEEKTQEAYDILQLFTNTVESHGAKVCKNNIMNMKFLPGCRSGRDFVGVFPEDMPAIVVSAGPSLAKNKHLLKEAKGKALIIVVDTAISHVMSMGVEPDIVFTADYNKPLKHFTSEGLSDIPFAVEADSNIEVLEYVKPKKTIFCSADTLLWGNIFERAGSEITLMDTGGSVATVAIANAIAWNIKRIILIGQDLTFTGGSMHIGEEVSEYDFSTGHYAYVKGIDGEDLITRKDYLSYLRWIENMAYTYSDIDFIDATEGGALKANTRVMTFREAIDQYCVQEYDIASIIEGIPRLFLGEDKELIIQTLNNMKTNLLNLRRRLNEGALECHKGSLMLSRGDYNVKQLKKIYATIEKLNEYILQSDERVLLSKLDAVSENEFEEDVYLEEDDDIKESIRLYDKCEKYYNAMADACPSLEELVDQCLRDLDE